MVLFIFGILIILAGFIAAIIIEEYKGATAIIAGILGTILIICSCVSYVPTGHTGIVTTFGKVHDETLDAGLAWHAPWDNVINMDNREQRVSFTLQSFSRDIQQVDVQGSINININKSTAMILYREVGIEYVNIFVTPRIQEDVKIVIARYTAEELIEHRQEASDAIYELIKGELETKGINVISLAVENIDFTDVFEAAVEAKQVATQEKQKAQTEQERMTMEAQQAAERQKIEANAKAEIQKINADAEAYAVKVQAEAQAEANKEIAESLTPELINYNTVLQWSGELPVVTGGSMSILDIGGLVNEE